MRTSAILLGGILAVSLLSAAAVAQTAGPGLAYEPVPAQQPRTCSWAVLARGGWFGLPDVIADELFYRHPSVNGAIYGAELRYHGNGGKNGVASFGIAVDHGSAKAEGIWQASAGATPVLAKGKVDFTAVTLNATWNIIPSSFLHPYVGFGIGTGVYRANYHENGESAERTLWLPVVTLPVGLAIEFGERVHLAAEARFINGVALGGVLQIAF